MESRIKAGKPGHLVIAKSWELVDLSTQQRELAKLEVVFQVKVDGGTELHSEALFLSEKSLGITLGRLRVLGWAGSDFAELLKGENSQHARGALGKSAMAVFTKTERGELRIEYLNEPHEQRAPETGKGSFLARLSGMVPDTDKRNAEREAERKAKNGMGLGSPPKTEPSAGGDDALPF